MWGQDQLLNSHPAEINTVRCKSLQRHFTLANEPYFVPDRRNCPSGSLTANEDHVRFQIQSGVISCGLNSLHDCENLHLKHLAVILNLKLLKFRTESYYYFSENFLYVAVGAQCEPILDSFARILFLDSVLRMVVRIRVGVNYDFAENLLC